MTTDNASYGSVSSIALLVPRYVNVNGTFDESTRPTLTAVEEWINQVSAMLNAQLATRGLVVPIKAQQVRRMLDAFVNEEVAALSEGVNGSGRFGPTNSRSSPFAHNRGTRWVMVLGKDVQDFIDTYAVGFEYLGAARIRGETATIGYRDTNEAGNATYALFQREAYGDDKFQINWDSND